MTVMEATGASGSSFAFFCGVESYKFPVVSSNVFAPEKLQAMVAFGSQVKLVSSPTGNFTPDLIPTMREEERELFLQ